MKASEVRIGNLLNHNNGFVVGTFTVNSIHISDLERDNAYAKEYEPIPLTEEWLIKLGFTLDNETDLYVSPDKFCSLQIEGYGQEVMREFNIPVENLKHVHQLQNLYFALTGEELNKQD
tara:strand:- start:135 stop:491 length:357 start_codon:yes stop_codon:yes gene_type:complete